MFSGAPMFANLVEEQLRLYYTSYHDLEGKIASLTPEVLAQAFKNAKGKWSSIIPSNNVDERIPSHLSDDNFLQQFFKFLTDHEHDCGYASYKFKVINELLDIKFSVYNNNITARLVRDAIYLTIIKSVKDKNPIDVTQLIPEGDEFISVKHGAKKFKCVKGDTLLHYATKASDCAAQTSEKRLIIWLITHDLGGENVNSKNAISMTPLQEALVQVNEFPENVALLILDLAVSMVKSKNGNRKIEIDNQDDQDDLIVTCFHKINKQEIPNNKKVEVAKKIFFSQATMKVIQQLKYNEFFQKWNDLNIEIDFFEELAKACGIKVHNNQPKSESVVELMYNGIMKKVKSDDTLHQNTEDHQANGKNDMMLSEFPVNDTFELKK